MSKVLLLIGIILLVYLASGYLAELLPIFKSQHSNGEEYIKVVEVDSNSINWEQFRFYALVVGLVLLAISQFINNR